MLSYCLLWDLNPVLDFLRSLTCIPAVPGPPVSPAACSALAPTEPPAHLFNTQPTASIYPSPMPGPGDDLRELGCRAGADFNQRVTQICNHLEANLEKGGRC